MLFALALLPAIALLIFIYVKDKKEKESFRLLAKCFFMGVLSIIPSLILEEILEDIFFSGDIVNGSFAYAFVMGFLVAGMSEELFKYMMLKKVTWKREEFDYMFDGIVYAVFVSLGFAALENIFYVLSGGTATAVLRMFTAIPGHTVFGVYMGYNYSHAKRADVEGDRAMYRKYRRKAMLVPMLIHGLYDALIMINREVVGDGIAVIMFLVWLVIVIVMFVKAFKLVKKCSIMDYCFTEVDLSETEPVADHWICPKCGALCEGNFCSTCGAGKNEIYNDISNTL